MEDVNKKKEAVTGGGKEFVTPGGKGSVTPRKKTFAAGAVGLIAVAFAALVIFSGSGGAFKPVKAAAGVVKIPLAEVSDGKAHYFKYKGGIKFFVLRSSDGAVRAAFDACDVCYKAKKGYRQEGDLMVCNNCGQSFPSVQINEAKGGCNPAPLDRRVDGCCVSIRASDIEQGAVYF